jgi:hypothetical protein
LEGDPSSAVSNKSPGSAVRAAAAAFSLIPKAAMPLAKPEMKFLRLDTIVRLLNALSVQVRVPLRVREANALSRCKR